MNPWQTLLAHRKAFTLAFAGQFLVVPMPLLAALLTQRVIDLIVLRDFVWLGLWLAAALATLEVLTQGFARSWYMAQYDLLAGIVERFRLNAARVALGNRLQTVGVLADRIQNDPNTLGAYPAELYKSVLRFIFSFVAIIVLLRISVWLTVVTVIPMSLFVVGIRSLQNRLINLQNEVAEREAAVTTALDEIVRNAPSILRHGGRNSALARYATLRNASKVASVRAAYWQGIVQSTQDNLESLTAALVLLVSVGELASGRLTLGQYVLFTLFLGWIVYVPMRLGELIAVRSSAIAARERLVSNVGEGSADHVDIDLAKSPPHPMTALTSDLQITVSELPGAQSPVQFVISPGSIAVIQGAVGSGKTSLIEALLGRGHAKAQIHCGDHAIQSLELMAGFAPATSEFIDVSLRENVTLAREGNWNRAIALSAFNSDAGVRFEAIFTNNTGLSGGQRARLAIARAAFDQASVLLLDDPTAALDEETANYLWRQLRLAGLTVIVASNHSGAAAIANQIIVLSRLLAVTAQPHVENVTSLEPQ